MSELWDFTRISVTQNNLQVLKEVEKHLFRALAQYWNLAYNCFTFGKVDLVPTVEEYTTLLCCLRIQVDKAYSRAANVPTFLKKLMSITGMSRKGLLWNILRELLSVEKIRSYAKRLRLGSSTRDMGNYWICSSTCIEAI
ncbi:hypothetical protein Goshw_014514 [Gossypium schwendimanii]|uniref:DUF7745 domain-containing protein n=1 Tax=Gossypium schwendimanii TaxID=34291 RepID=A0A7J9M3X8_GOSSC|nr:hypothetical protein [Gossypium schwendimanii]